MLTRKLGRHVEMERIGQERFYREADPDLSLRCINYPVRPGRDLVVEHTDTEVFSELVVCENC